MNCIFVCIFNQEQYIQMFYLLLESIFIYGNLNDTEIVVYTSTPFMNIIQQSHLFNSKIKFEINNNYNSIDSACKSRLDIFSLQTIHQYSKILYLDTDIIIKNDMNKLFDLCTEDVLYVFNEGTIDSDLQYWGKQLFGDEINNYTNKTAFSSGILLFNNCNQIKKLFDKIKEDILLRPECNIFYDQPYIIYNAFKYNLFNNTIISSFIINNDTNIHSNKIIHHFCGGPGIYEHKIISMKNFLSNLKNFTIDTNIIKTKLYINEYLLPIISNCDELLEGNIFMNHHTTTYTDNFLNKTKNISNLVLNKHIQHVMEIGFNSGFSTLLMLMSNPNIHVTCFDLGEHKYTLPCYEKIKETFGDRLNLILGDSTKTLPLHSGVYDIIHIDGGHSTEVAKNDIINSYRLSKQGTILIMDDYDFYNLHTLWDEYKIQYNLKPLTIQLYDSPHHDIKYVNN
jgi:predicted O-methyltransferase YrrM